MFANPFEGVRRTAPVARHSLDARLNLGTWRIVPMRPAKARLAVQHDRGKGLSHFVGNRCAQLFKHRKTHLFDEMGPDRLQTVVGWHRAS